MIVTQQVLSSCGVEGKSRGFKSQEGNFINIYLDLIKVEFLSCISKKKISFHQTMVKALFDTYKKTKLSLITP